MSYSLSASGTGLSLVVAGFSDKLPVLLEAVLAKMEQPVAPQSYALVSDRYRRFLSNQASKQRPCDLAARKSRELTMRHCWTVEERL